MIVLLIILVVAAVGGVAAYVVMQYAGVDSKVPTTSGTSGGFHSGFIERRGGPWPSASPTPRPAASSPC